MTELEPGVVQVTMSLPWALDRVHCYALASPDGWTLVDAGRQTLVWWDNVLKSSAVRPYAAGIRRHDPPAAPGSPAVITRPLAPPPAL